MRDFNNVTVTIGKGKDKKVCKGTLVDNVGRYAEVCLVLNNEAESDKIKGKVFIAKRESWQRWSISVKELNKHGFEVVTNGDQVTLVAFEDKNIKFIRWIE